MLLKVAPGAETDPDMVTSNASFEQVPPGERMALWKKDVNGECRLDHSTSPFLCWDSVLPSVPSFCFWPCRTCLYSCLKEEHCTGDFQLHSIQDQSSWARMLRNDLFNLVYVHVFMGNKYGVFKNCQFQLIDKIERNTGALISKKREECF